MLFGDILVINFVNKFLSAIKDQIIFILKLEGMEQGPLEIIVEQAKQFFNAKAYNKAIQIIIRHQSELPQDSMDIYYDIMGCCYFMLAKYEEADQYFNKAIIQNDSNIDYFISKASCQRYLGNNKQVLEILQNIEGKVSYPSLYYNYRQIYIKDLDEYKRYQQLLKNSQSINEKYEQNLGLEPTFLKKREDKIDFIQKNDQKIQSEMLIDISYMDIPELTNYLNKIKKDIRGRNFITNCRGVLPNKKLATLFNRMEKVIDCYNIYDKMQKQLGSIQLLSGQQQLVMLAFRNLLIQIIQKKCDSLVTKNQQFKQQLGKIENFVGILSKKQIFVSSNMQNYKDQTKNNVNILTYHELFEGQIKMEMTQKSIFLYISANFQRKITPTKLDKALLHQNQEVRRFYLNLYWIIILKSVFNSKHTVSGYDWQLYTIFKQVFNYLYNEIIHEDFTLLGLEVSIQFIFKKLESFMSSDFLNNHKKEKIIFNFDKITYDLESVDISMANYCSSDKNIIFLYEKTQSKSAMIFRNHLQLGNLLRGKIAEAFIIFCYHLRDSHYRYTIVSGALDDMLNQDSQTLNGRQSLMQNFKEYLNPTPLFDKIVQFFLD